MTALPLPLRGLVGFAHVGAVVGLGLVCFFAPIPLGLLVVASSRGCRCPHPEPRPCSRS